MSKPTDASPGAVQLYYLPLVNRVPLKFGAETVTHVTCARVRIEVRNEAGRTAFGWGETPLSVPWVWPSTLSYETREEALKEFCSQLTLAWAGFDVTGHPLEVGHAFIEKELPRLHRDFNATRPNEAALPWLAALVCCSPFDIAFHDAYGRLNEVAIYQTYNARFLNRDLAAYLTPANDRISFQNLYPEDFFQKPVPATLPAWHLIGGKDPLDSSELTGSEPRDGYPILLRDWIDRDGLRCLKIKLRGNDPAWDYARLIASGQIAIEKGVLWLTADFNCTVTDPRYVNEMLDRLLVEHPRIYGMILYVEQPFPYDLEENQIDVHSVSARKPLFMDESAHDWKFVKLGRELGWSGVALKTCKTQSGAILSLCWAKAHGMTLMVQDLTNPMLAQIPHLLLAAHAGTIMGVETNSMQFYPEASSAEAEVHPGLYRRRDGQVNLSSIQGFGFGYRDGEIKRTLPSPSIERSR